MAHTYVLVHGAWHTGQALEPVADLLRAAGHTVHCPTLAGNRVGDDRYTANLSGAVASLVDFVETRQLERVRLVGHGYGGMVISGAAETLLPRLGRLVYVNAFVPLPGEALVDLAPPAFRGLAEDLALEHRNAVMLPFEFWRELFINDADFQLAQASYARLKPQPYRTLTEPSAITRPLAELAVGKSYVNCVLDTVMPASLPWHPRLSERLGLFRYIECAGSHEAWFTEPAALARAIEQAGRC
jgi:pimeloyl-ACP methyl ester carboxylesterase